MPPDSVLAIGIGITYLDCSLCLFSDQLMMASCYTINTAIYTSSIYYDGRQYFTATNNANKPSLYIHIIIIIHLG
jgi:hypothetical protein